MLIKIGFSNNCLAYDFLCLNLTGIINKFEK